MLAGPEEIFRAVARLQQGGVVAFPTETVYGLGADALSETAVRRVFQLKGRPPENPLIVHVSSVEMARSVVLQWPDSASMAAAAFWPGPLTLVLPKASNIPDLVTAGGAAVGVRCPDHPTTLALLEALGRPLVGPSANPSGRVSPTRAEHVSAAFSDEDVLVLDGGPCRAGIESTVLSLAGEARVLRPGVIGAEELSRVLGCRVGTGAGLGSGPVQSPGLLGAHYAPIAPIRLAAGPQVPDIMRGATGRVVLISAWALEPPPPHILLRLSPDAEGYAAGLYAALREADSLEPGLILVERPRIEGADEKSRAVWEAVMDRLNRAATGTP